MSDPRLRVLAVSAPHWPVRPPGVAVRSFTAGTPFSLQNAVRLAAGRAANRDPTWGESNWVTMEGRRSSVLLLEFMDEARETFSKKLLELSPNLLLIGTMTLGMRGAIELARLAREMLGRKCLIVLGGKHCNETLRRAGDEVTIHPICPLGLMSQGTIPSVDEICLFDLVVSGQGEDVIAALGEMILDVADRPNGIEEVRGSLHSLKRASGLWVAGWLEGQNIVTIASARIPLYLSTIPSAPHLFGLQSRFAVFDHVLTGHAYSDMGLGCHNNCFFCSEGSGINGKLRTSVEAVERLCQHLEDIWIAGGEGKKGPVAASIEDSILLGGDVRLIESFLEKSHDRAWRQMRIGCQMTVNDIETLHRRGLLKELAAIGCDYVAFGMETVNEGVASRMSKYKRRGLWTEQNRKAVWFLSDAKLRAGVYVLWGLGETQIEREHQLEQLDRWREDYSGQPCAVGLNWATLHPWAMPSNAKRPDFLQWGTDPRSAQLKLMVEMFGEASEMYPFRTGEVPTIQELKRLKRLFMPFVGEDGAQ